MKLRFVFLYAICLVGGPVSAQEAKDQEQRITDNTVESRADRQQSVPTLRRSGPSAARFLGSREFAVPDAAKRAGHNGSVKYRVTVSVQGKPTNFELIEGSGSELLDQAALKHLEQARFAPAYGADLRPIEGTEDVFLRYSRWKSTEPGEGLANYKCTHLIAEYDWWRGLDVEIRPNLFVLQNMYTSVPSLLDLETARAVGYRERAKQRKKMDEEFLRIVKKCRKNPETLFLDHIDRSDEFVAMLSIL